MFSSIFSKTPKMEWEGLSSNDQLDDVDKKSQEQPVILFKHSTRCPISTMALGRFERSYDHEVGFKPYFLDLIANREVSNGVADRYNVIHQSPQVIVVKDGKAVYDASHNAINFEEIRDLIKN